MSEKFQPTYTDIHRAALHLAEQANQLPVGQNVKLVYLQRGGMLPGLVLSHLMFKHVVPIAYSSNEGAGDDRNHSNILPDIDADTIFLVDDIFDTGRTLSEVYNFYNSKRVEHGGYLKYIYSIVFVYMKHKHEPLVEYKPDLFFYIPPKGCTWVDFPYEVRDANEGVGVDFLSNIGDNLSNIIAT